MANGGGAALEAQQRIGAEIPYKNAELAVSGAVHAGQAMLSAYHTASQVKLAKSRLEQALMRMDMDMRFKEQNYERQVAAMNMNYALREQAHGDTMRRMEDQLMLGAWRNARQDQTEQWKQDQQTRKEESLTNFAGQMATLPDPSDPTYESSVWERIHNNALGANTPVGRAMATKAFGDRNNKARMAASQWNADFNAWYKNYKATYGQSDLNPLLNPEILKPQLVDKSGNFVGLTEEGKIPEGAKYTGKRYYEVPDPSDPLRKRTIPVTLPEKTITQITREYKDLMARKQKLPTQVNNEYVTAYPAGTNPADRPVFKDANGNKAYKNPDGTYEPIPK